MADLKRVELDEAMEELVSGGDLMWASVTSGKRGYHVWSEFNPDTKYFIEYNNVISAKRCVQIAKLNNPNISDDELIHTLMQGGYIVF